jgi:hypothetical protein
MCWPASTPPSLRPGFRTIIGVSNYDPAEESRLVDSFLGWRPAALVLTGLEHEAGTVARLKADGTRCIEIMDLGDDPVDVMIGFSHETAGRVSARHLISRGYRRIGYVGHDLTRDSRAAKRHRAFVAALAEAGLALQAERMLSAPSGRCRGAAGTGRPAGQDARCRCRLFLERRHGHRRHVPLPVAGHRRAGAAGHHGVQRAGHRAGTARDR